MPTIDYANIGVVINRQFITGVITEFDHDNQTATVRTISPAVVDDPLTPVYEGKYTPVIKKEYSGVTFFYHCKDDSVLRSAGSIEGGITGFAIGDEVIMEGTLSTTYPLSTDFTDLKIISRADEPRKCTKIRIYQTYIESGNWYVGVYSIVNDVVTKTQILDPKNDFDSRYDIQSDKPIYIVGAHLDTNKLFLIIHYKTTILGVDYIWPLLVQYPIRTFYSINDVYYCNQHQWSLNTDQPFAFNCGEPWNNAIFGGGYRVSVAFSRLSHTGVPGLPQSLIANMWEKNYKRTAESDYEGRGGTRWLPWLVGIASNTTVDQYNNFTWPAFQVQDKMWNDDIIDDTPDFFDEHIPHHAGSINDFARYGIGHDGTAFWTEVDPPDYYQRYLQVRGIGFLGNRMILGVLICYDDEHTPTPYSYKDYYPSKCDPCQDKFIVECYIAIFEGPNYTYLSPFLFEAEESVSWQTPAFLDFKQTELLTFSTIAEFERINQILGYDERIFISFRFPAEIYLYDDTGAVLANIVPGGDNLCNMAIVESEINGKPCLACQKFGGNMVFYDIDTLDVIETFRIPDIFVPPCSLTGGVEERQSSLVVNVPILPKAILHIESFRYQENSNTNEMKIINYSPLASKAAQEHANWCVENGRCSHDGINGDWSHARLYEYGIINTSENLVIVYTGAPVEEAITAWKSSPGHKANLLYLEDEGVGWGMATYPVSCTEIIAGAGTYIPSTGGYTTSDTVFLVPEEYRGRMKVYVFNGYVC